jgi:hypothetical protein
MSTTENKTNTPEAAHWTSQLVALGACPDAIRWARNYPTFDAAWSACERGDWLLWYACRVSGGPESESRRRVVLAACDCAELALPTYERRYPGDNRPRRAIETARRWARGEAGITLSDVHAASDSAYAASDSAYAAAAYAAAYSAHAASDSAYAASDSTYASAAYAAAYSAHAAAYSAAAAARNEMLRTCADIVRRHYPTPPTITGASK